MNQERVKGFPDVMVAPSMTDGLVYFAQISGLGGMKPNTIVLGWPRGWRQGERGEKKMRFWLDTVRNITTAKQHALLVPKSFESWPDSTDKLGGTIDIWWIVHDGGLLMLIPFLLRQHRTWKNSKLRIFTVARKYSMYSERSVGFLFVICSRYVARCSSLHFSYRTATQHSTNVLEQEQFITITWHT